jgi:hypothetical protein
MYQFKLLLLSLSLFLTKACYPVSHVIVGETQIPIDYTDVKVYPDYPDNYEKIAIIETSSDLAFKDLSIEFTHQQKTNKSLERLKKEAASLGANGVVIQNIAKKIKTKKQKKSLPVSYSQWGFEPLRPRSRGTSLRRPPARRKARAIIGGVKKSP